MPKYNIQAAKEFDDQSAAWRKGHPSLAALERTHLAQRKYDGCNMIVRISSDGHGEAISRTGEQVLSVDHIINDVEEVYGRGWCVMGEVWREDTPFPEISGMYRRHNAEPTLRFVVYDIVPAGSFAIGLHDVPYRTRFSYLVRKLREVAKTAPEDSSLIECAYYPPGTYGDPQALANQLVAQGGYDGLVLRDPASWWEAAEARDGQLIKVKPIMSFDLRVVGVEEGKGKMAGMAGKLVLEFRGKQIKAGGGDYDTRRSWFANPESIIGKIMEVECLGVTEDGSLREPRLKGERFDKLEPDA